MKAAAFAFASDMVDEGPDNFLSNILDAGGMGGVAMAAVYHAARDIFPHNPIHKLSYLEPGELSFQPSARLYTGLRIQPVVSRYAREIDPLQMLCRAAEERGAAVSAWAVLLHTDRLDLNGIGSPVNAYGSVIRTDFCPANPDARAYARAVVTDLARYPLSRILVEAAHYLPLEHGFTHERYLIDLDARARYLLGLCFCDYCVLEARARGVQVDELRSHVISELDGVFAAAPRTFASEISRAEVGMIGGGLMEAFLEVRGSIVASFLREIREAIGESGPSISILEPSGGVKGYATGRPTGELAPSLSWAFGIDVSVIADIVDEIEVVAYAEDVERVVADVEAYRSLAREGCSIAAALRPMPPDCRSPDNLIAKVEALQQRGVRAVDFYHYGLMRLDAIEWIRSALA